MPKLKEVYEFIPTKYADTPIEELPEKFLEAIKVVNRVRDSAIRRKMAEAKQKPAS